MIRALLAAVALLLGAYATIVAAAIAAAHPPIPVPDPTEPRGRHLRRVA